MTARILLLTGMTPDARIFERLAPLLPNATVVPWIVPLSQESIVSYAARLACSLAVGNDVVVCGVSFGGIIARELAFRLNAKACVLISSVSSPQQLPPWFRVFRTCARLPLEPILNSVGMLARAQPTRLSTRSTTRLTKLAGVPGAWHRWATSSVLRWQPTPGLDAIPLMQIHGDRDRTFPLGYISADVTIAAGGHVLPLTHPVEMAAVISRLAAE